MFALPLIYSISAALSLNVPAETRLNESRQKADASYQQSLLEASTASRVLTFAGSDFPKWRDVLSRHQSQLATNSSKWRALIGQVQSGDEDSLLQRVHAAVNKSKYVRDERNWRAADYWATPLELFSRGGDCEDFAIAKYLLLRELGMSASRMHLAISDDHAVLIVSTERGPVVLDNRRKNVRPLTQRYIEKTKFTVNELNWSIKIA